jgi:hypothetical protein
MIWFSGRSGTTGLAPWNFDAMVRGAVFSREPGIIVSMKEQSDDKAGSSGDFLRI